MRDDKKEPSQPAAPRNTLEISTDAALRRQAEETLRVSEERFRAVFNQAAVGIAIVALDGRFLELNRKFCDIVGFSFDELRQRTFIDITYPADLPETLAQVGRLRSGEIPHYILEKRYVRKDGSTVWSLTTVTMLREAGGESRNLIGIVEDITDRKRAEDEMHRTALRLQLALSAGEQGDWSWDAKTDVVLLSDRAAEAFGLPWGMPISWTKIRDMLVGDDAERARIAVEQALTNHSDYDMEYRLRRPSGELCWIAARGRGTYDEDGTITGMIGLVHDVTDRRRAEEMHTYLAAVVEFSDDAIISKNLEGIISTWNRGAERMFGYAAHEIIGRNITTLIPPDLIDEEAVIISRLKRGERIEHYETVRMRNDGSLLQVSLTVSPVKDGNGRIIGASKIARDITERKQVEQALRETNQRKDEFLATLAHELRNPLAPIRQAVSIAQSPLVTPEQKNWSHEVIGRQVRNMSLLLDDLLDVSRVSRGTLDVRKVLIDLRSIVDAAVETARPLIDAKRHTLTIDIPQEPVRLFADQLRLAQVLSNLLANAAKYTDPGGQIRLSAICTRTQVMLRISDTGIGISTEELPNIFQMFAQVKSTQDRSDGGLGIGLALAKGLTELHGGTLRASSKGLGYGSEFTIVLPLPSVGVAEVREVQPAQTQTRVSTGSLRVLVADDNRDAAESLAMLLRMEGHTVHVAFNGEDALAAFADFKPQWAFLDIGMPGLSGHEVAQHARQMPEGRTARLVAVTGWGKEADKARALDAGFDMHFTKPPDPDALIALMRT